MINEQTHLSIFGLHAITHSPSVIEQIAEVSRLAVGCSAVIVRLKDPAHSLLEWSGVTLDDYLGTDLIAVSAATEDCQRWARAIALECLDDPLKPSAGSPQFFASIPVRSRQGDLIGLIAAVDPAPRPLSDDQLILLRRQAAVLAALTEIAG